VAELMEAHRIAGVSWGKLQRNIAIELALDPSRRVIQGDFLKLSRAEYDRLIEAGPIIDDSVIKQFNNKFKNYKVSIPSICNGLDKCSIYKVDPKIKINHDEFIEGIEDIVSDEEKNITNGKLLNQVIINNNEKKEFVEKVDKVDKVEKETLIPQKVENETLLSQKDEKDEDIKKVELIINVKETTEDESETNSSEDKNINEFLDSIEETK